MALHKYQEALLDFLRERRGSLHGVSLREIGKKIGSGTGAQVVAHHLEQLEKKGYIRRVSVTDRVFKVLDQPARSVVYVPLYRVSAQCGPDGMLGEDAIIDRIPLSSKTFGISDPEDYFLMKARGSSMEPRIHAGDLVLAQKQNTVENGDISILVHNGMPKIKKVLKIGGGYVLSSFNKQIPEEVVGEDEEIRICGRVRGVINLH